MLSPHELKSKQFTRSLRGYSSAEVDEHIEFIIEKYTELYRENDELEKKLRLTQAQLDAMKSEERSIRDTLVNAQKASSRIINEANEQADVIMRSAKNSCDKLIADFKNDVKAEYERLLDVQNQVAQFKAMLFDGYKAHIEFIESIAPDIKPAEYTDDIADKASRKAIGMIKKQLGDKSHVISGSEQPFEDGDADTYDSNETPVEVPIPSDVTAQSKKAEFSPTAIRDTKQSEDDKEAVKGMTEESIIISRDSVSGGGSIIESIKRLNSQANSSSDSSDDDFIKVLKNLADESDKGSTTSEFDIVYDNKNK